MKRQLWHDLILFALFIASGLCSASAQTYSIDWFKIAGGGGASTGGVYSVNGTIGQPDAAAVPMSGGSFSLTGGFWAVYAVQTTGAPKLSVIFTSTNTAVVYWPSSAAGWNLQQNLDLGTGNWVMPSQTVNHSGVNNFIVVNPATGTRLYRLNHP